MKLLDLDRIFSNDCRPATVPEVDIPESDTQEPDAPEDMTPERLPPDWYQEFIERAAIMEFDGGMPREVAEHHALLDVLGQMRAAGELPG